MKEVHQLCHVNHQKMLVRFRHADQTHNVHVYQMALQNAHVCPATLKVQTQFVDVLNQRVPANHSHVVLVQRAMFHVIPFAIVPKELLEIRSDNVVHQLLFVNYVNRDHAEPMQIAMWQMVVNNVSVVQVLLEMLTMDVSNHRDLYVNQIHAHRTVNVLFKRMVNQFVSVHSEWEAIQQQKDVTDTNVMLTVIVLSIMLALVSDAATHVQAHAALEQVVKLIVIIQFVTVRMA